MNRSEVKWTSLELSGLLEDEESHVHFARTTKHLALHPYHLNNIQRGINQILGSSLNTYDRELKGFMLAFRSPKLLSNLGEILYDSPFIHVDVEADFYLFCPTVGTFLKGIVNKKGLDHIVVLVHKIYTISIPKPDDTEEWLGELVEIGQEVKCCVSQIDNKSKPPYICATLRSDYSQGCRLSLNNIDNVDSTIESMNTSMRIDASANGISEDDGVSEKERKKHRKKHKKSHENDTESVCKVENISEASDNVKNNSSVTIKSEKKSRYQNIQDTVLSTDEFLNNSEVDNVSKKHKKSKKISKSLLSDDTVLDEHTELRKAMKRESSIPLDNITETETKRRKKQAKKSKESDSEIVSIKTEKEVICMTEGTISKHIKTEKEEQYSETERKKKKKHAKKSKESDSETVSIKTEKEDKICMAEGTIPKHIKAEKEEQHSETEKKKKKKHTKKSKESDSETVSIKTEKEDKICMAESTIVKHIKVEKEEQHSETEKKKKKKHTKKSKESDPETVSIKTENKEIICQTGGIIPKHIKSEKQCVSNSDLSSSNLEDNVSKKHKKNKKPYMKMSDSESGGC